MMRVSVALASFNGEKYIVEQLKSILNQSIQPDIILIGDDLSKDRTIDLSLSVLEESKISSQISRNIVRKGYARNFNDLLESAQSQSDIVFLSDQDDYWFNEKIKEVLKIYKENHRIHLTINNAIFTDENLCSQNRTKLDSIDSSFGGRRNWVMGCAVSVSSSFLGVVLPIPYKACDHDDWIVTIARLLKVYQEIEVPLQFYRRHGANASQIALNNTGVKKELRAKALDYLDLTKIYNILISKIIFKEELLTFFIRKEYDIVSIQNNYRSYFKAKILLRLRAEIFAMKILEKFVRILK